MTCAARTNLEAALPDAELVDAGEATMRMRMIKSAEERALIRDGAAIADIGGAACVEAIAEHAPEHEVALHATRAMVREIARRYPHVELQDTWTWFQSGPNTDGAHNPVTTRRVGRGDVLSLNCFPMIAGYYHALERTLFFDHVPDGALRPWEVNCAVHRRGIELIRPGARCMDVARELNAIYAEHGLLDRRTFGYGHSFGTLCHYYGREAGLEFREDVETVLAPGMVVSMEPMITVPGGNARSRWIPRARHARRDRGWGREPDRLPVRAGAQRGRGLTGRDRDKTRESPGIVFPRTHGNASHEITRWSTAVESSPSAQLGAERPTSNRAGADTRRRLAGDLALPGPEPNRPDRLSVVTQPPKRPAGPDGLGRRGCSDARRGP